MLPNTFNISNWFTLSHPSKSENYTRIEIAVKFASLNGPLNSCLGVKTTREVATRKTCLGL